MRKSYTIKKITANILIKEILLTESDMVYLSYKYIIKGLPT